ncbi:MAG: GntR family transcriptional regulator [Deltaproteobacteria bacterium]|nr:GntR family transcriptional regulator [Deltaproteobacteria bacterium]
MEHYGIGRTPLREIFIELQREGMIRRVPRAGTWVAPMDLDYIKQVAEVRVALEGLAGELAAERITEDQLALLGRVLEKANAGRTGGDVNYQELVEYEARFHRIVYAATGNKKLEELLSEYLGIGTRLWYYLIFTEKQLFRLFDEQQLMFGALKKRDGKLARRHMERHTRAYFNHINGIRKP